MDAKPQPVYRPFVTLPNGHQTFVAADVRTEEDKQAVLNHVGGITRRLLGIADDAPVPPNVKDLAAKVEFFRVAQG